MLADVGGHLVFVLKGEGTSGADAVVVAEQAVVLALCNGQGV